MACIVNSRCVLAVRDLKASTRYYTNVLGFREDPIDAEGWSFLTRNTFRVMLGECPNEKPADCRPRSAGDIRAIRQTVGT